MAQASIRIGASAGEYQQVMKQAAAQMKQLSSEYSLAAAQAKMYGTQSDALRAKVTELTAKMEAQRTTVANTKQRYSDLETNLDKTKRKHEELKGKVDAAKEAYDQSCEATGKNSEESKRLKEELNRLESQLANTERSIGRQETALAQQEAAVSQSEAALAQLELQLRDVNAELARQKFDEYAEKADRFGSAVEDAGKKMMIVTGAVTAVGGASVKTTAEFEAQMSKVGAISGATGEELEQLADKAKEMGARTKFSASESAQAMEYMAMAGWKTEDMLNGIEGIMSLAAASGEELGTTSDIVTDALTAFGLAAKDSGHFADVLAQASANANTNVSMLGESFKYVAPVAGTLGYSAEDISVALGLMANAGIKGSQAGTSLRTALANMVSPTKDMLGVMNKFGIEIENADGTMKPFGELMDELREKFSITTDAERENNYAMAEQRMVAEGYGHMINGLTGEQKKLAIAYSEGISIVEALSEKELKQQAKERLGIELTKERKITEEEYYELAASMGKEALDGLTEAGQAEAAAALFGKEAMSGMLNVINASEKDYQKLTEAIYGCDGAAGEMAAVMQDNLQGQITSLKSKLEGVSITLGEILLPYVKDAVTWFSDLVDKFANLDEGTQRNIVKVGAAVAAIGPLLLVVGKLIKFSGQVSSVLGKVASAMSKAGGMSGLLSKAVAGVKGAFGFLLSPAGLAVAAIAAVAAAVVYLWKTNEDFRNNITETWEKIKTVFQEFTQGITERINALGFDFKDFGEVVMAAWQGFCDLLAPIIEGAFATIGNKISTAFDMILGVWDFFSALFRGDWEGAWEAVKGVFSSYWDGIKEYFSIITTALQGAVDVFLGWFGTSWSEVWGSIKSFFEGIWNGITSFFTTVLDGIRTTAETAWDAIYTTVSTWLDNVWQAVSGVFTACWETVESIWQTIQNVIQVAFMFIIELINAAFELITAPFRFIWENCKETVISIWEDIKAWISEKIEAIKVTLETVMDAIKTMMETVWNVISTTASTVWNAIKDTVTNVINAVKSVLETVMNAIKTMMEAVWNVISTTASTVWNAIKDTITDVINAVKSVLETVWNAISNTITDTVNTIKNTVTSVFNAVKSTVASIFNSVKATVTSVWNGIRTAVTTPINAAKSAVVTAINSIKSTVSSVFNSVKATATSVWNSIKNAIETPINTARDTVKGAIDKIKGFFNFSWSLPSLKMPHPTISGSFSLNPPSVPHFSIEWYKNGGIMTEPTVFGGNRTTLFAGGEAGDEAILPLAPFYTSLSAMLDRKFEQLQQSYRIQVTVVNEMDGEVIAEKTTELVADNIVKEYDRRR